MSALIFVALAVAWAVYLVPKALKHHDEVARSRTVDRFSHTMRVLARREPVDKKTARLVTPAQATAPAAAEPAAQPTPEPTVQAAPVAPTAARRAAAKRATKRRRNVLAALLVVNLAVVAVAAFSVIAWPYVAIPAALLVAWLVACRLMVKGERKVLAPTTRMPADAPVEEKPVEAPVPAVAETELDDEIDPMVDTSAGIAAIVDPAMWDPVPVTLPTYVTKPTATRRTVRTIDLDSTGVWTSGRTDADSQLAREADEADKAARKSRRDGDDQQAVGS
ncbi:divisome protein SepX/GlpR [Nocardioides conyzicola]